MIRGKDKLVKAGSIRKGFTLVELIVVMAILGIVTTAIIATFQFVMTSFRHTTLRADQQADARYAMEQVKREVIYAKSVVVNSIIPASLPTATGVGYCYFDTVNRVLVMRTLDGTIENYLQGLPDDLVYQLIFEPVSSVSGDPNDAISMSWQIADYSLDTIAYIQNMDYWLGSSVTATYTTGPGIYIQFSN